MRFYIIFTAYVAKTQNYNIIHGIYNVIIVYKHTS